MLDTKLAVSSGRQAELFRTGPRRSLPFSTRLARRVACVTLRLLFGLQFSLAGGKFFGLTCKLCGLGGLRLFLQPLLLDLGRLALETRLLAPCSSSFALLPPLKDFGIVRSGLRAEFVQNASAGLLRGLLPIGKSWFLESSHGDVITSLLVFDKGVFGQRLRASPNNASTQS